MKYKAIFIDVDDTLLDYVPCCRQAYNAAMPDHPAYFDLFFQIAGRLFAEAKHGKYTIAEVMDLYPQEFIERMSELENERMSELERAQMTDTFKHAFRAAWGTTHTLVPEVKETLETLRSKGYRLFAASNSFGHLQRSRMEHAGILHYFEDTYISLDLGYDKPDRRFYDEALRRCGLQAEEVLMVGDSITTDILGAQALGFDTCWFNRRNEPLPEHCTPTYTIHSLLQLTEII